MTTSNTMRKRQRENRRLGRLERNEIAQILEIDVRLVDEVRKTRPKSLMDAMAELKGYDTAVSHIYTDSTSLRPTRRLPGSYGQRG